MKTDVSAPDWQETLRKENEEAAAWCRARAEECLSKSRGHTPPVHIKSAEELECDFLMRQALAYLITYQKTLQSDKLETLITRIALKAG